MDPALIAALAAVGGSLVGGMTSFATTYVTQRHQVRRERLMRELERRKALYGEFIVRTAELFVDSLDKNLEQPERLVGVAATIGRIGLVSDPAVSQAAKSVLDSIIESYQRPPITPDSIVTETSIGFQDPLYLFEEACRIERQAILREL